MCTVGKYNTTNPSNTFCGFTPEKLYPSGAPKNCSSDQDCNSTYNTIIPNSCLCTYNTKGYKFCQPFEGDYYDYSCLSSAV